MAKKYMLKPVMGTTKQSFYLEDENGEKVYEGNMIKLSLFGASPYEFINHITQKTEQHEVGKTLTSETEGLGIISFLSKKSAFKFDGQKIWDLLHDQGIRIETGLSSGKIGMTYDVSFKGEPLATIASSSPKGRSFITTDLFYDVICEEKDLDLVFLVAFAIAKTDMAVYN